MEKQIFVKFMFFNILSYNGIERIPELMRDAGINERWKLILGFDISIINVAADIDYLNDFLKLVMLFVPLYLQLNVH